MESNLMDKVCPHILQAVMLLYFPVLPYYCLPNLLVWTVVVITTWWPVLVISIWAYLFRNDGVGEEWNSRQRGSSNECCHSSVGLHSLSSCTWLVAGIDLLILCFCYFSLLINKIHHVKLWNLSLIFVDNWFLGYLWTIFQLNRYYNSK